jgi:GrpB-like predicted nucleotidyltransferase (UPF0157 family)
MTLACEREINRLVHPNPLWPQAFAEEAARIRDALGEKALAIEHYGSTAVPGLRAKPNIDLQIGVADINHGLLFIEPIAKLGYDYAGDQGIPRQTMHPNPFGAHGGLSGGAVAERFEVSRPPALRREPARRL